MINIVNKVENYKELEFPNKIKKVILLANKLLNNGNKVIIWSNFIQNLLILYKYLKNKGIDRYLLYGEIPRDPNINEVFNREQQIREFINNPNPSVLIANPAAGGESISLHKCCHHAIYLDRTFNCGQYLQSLDRIHRIGLAQDQETNYYILMSEGTIDEVIRERLQVKEARMREIIDEDLPLLSLDIESEDPSDDKYIDEDFDQVVDSIRKFTEDEND